MCAKNQLGKKIVCSEMKPDELNVDYGTFNWTEAFTVEEFEEQYYHNPKRHEALYSIDRYDTLIDNQRRKLGGLLTHRLGRIISKLGFQTEIAKGQSNGVDIKVSHKNKIVLVGETKNFNIKSNLDYDTIDKIIKNLNEYSDCEKYLIYGQLGNKDVLKLFRNEGIDILEIGYQLMPKWFYNSLEPSLHCYREIDRSWTTQDLRGKMLKMLFPIMVEHQDDFVVYFKL
jgi:hypothetical protein